MFISDAPPGASFRVVGVTVGGEVGKRLADMGFTEGAEGAVIRAGFLRGPFQVRICGYDILIRRSEAKGIEVEPVGERNPGSVSDPVDTDPAARIPAAACADRQASE
ncbi:MAG: FeoA family protein [Rectinemataceae bacterium]|nr:FeoA family protein [Rectinemataceae bacterium]